MEQKTGYLITIEVDEFDVFAKAILHLTNLKSSDKGLIFDIITFEGTDKISVISRFDITPVLTKYGEVELFEEITLLETDYDDYTKSFHDKLDKLEDEDKKYYVNQVFKDNLYL